ncbi:UNVERIFIED_CONTAM: hypothetical protein O8I53_09585 [Campylobacter lari]
MFLAFVQAFLASLRSTFEHAGFAFEFKILLHSAIFAVISATSAEYSERFFQSWASYLDVSKTKFLLIIVLTSFLAVGVHSILSKY